MMDKESSVTGDDGELFSFMKDLKEESKDMMKKLVHIDSVLVNIQEQMESNADLDKDALFEKITEIRGIIGNLEKEDSVEIDEEDEADTLLGKLKKWVDQIV